MLFLFNKLNGADFDTLDDDFVVIVSSQAVSILQNVIRSQRLNFEQERVYELLRSTTDVLAHNTHDAVHNGLARVLGSQLGIDETLMFIVRAPRLLVAVATHLTWTAAADGAGNWRFCGEAEHNGWPSTCGNPSASHRHTKPGHADCVVWARHGGSRQRLQPGL